MKLSSDSTVLVAKDVVSCDLLDEVAILNVKDGVYYGLDPVGARIWNLIQKQTKVSEVLEILLTEYDVKKDRCQDDLLELLQQLAENELIIINEETTK